MSNYEYDLIVIGGGAAGITSAFTAQGLGKKVAIVEENKLGGECTWSGCVPSKALIKASKVAHESQTADKYGIKTTVEIDDEEVLDYVNSVIQKVYQKENPEVFAEAGITVFKERAEFVDGQTLNVGTEEITADKIMIATGSKPFVPPIPGLDEVDYLTNESFFELSELPASMIVLGGGAIGVELAQALNRLGVEVTIVEMQDNILPREEPELVNILRDKLVAEGVNLLTGYKAEQVAQNDEQLIEVTAVDKAENERTVSAEKLLVAVGRKPNTETLNLDEIGVETKRQGIVVDQTLKTSVPNIYACGDIVGPYRFSHVSNYEGVTATLNAVLPLPIKRKVDYSNLLWVTYTDPELAHLGLTEAQAREEYGEQIKIYEYDYAELDRAETDSNGEGKAEFICDKKNKIIGVHILGARAGELIHESQVLKNLNQPLTKLNAMIHAYPTYSELNKQVGKEAQIKGLKEKFSWVDKLMWWRD
ncbi:dihydrolipoyl dehydrogenase family protein [Halanaerobacter jeridensis]|uniref:Pyruvate/2-oxoglutarate dehydrogenase complex dihydrolipoamide dehydrogenase (E3) component n=1 Tax=Halanaerobacter jeridensis TaxID=706427 RepID=A0A939BMT2_9FIRM|nr:NAD(P)/FAD-dependent oxidoreductase [Halanaerobacter jeridensis]MBM7557420.1 pyruvate/2-oxoglutarate dehydrogenase complex dihydrolipoamide dehydrogenase (E3) component [Halanaerobacter jeridensis]